MTENFPYKIENQKLFKEHLNLIKSKLIDYTPILPACTDYYAVLVEFRDLPETITIVKEHMYFLNETNSPIKWGLQIFHCEHNEKQIKESLKDIKNIDFINLQPKNITNRKEHTEILKTVDFWEKVRGEKILMFQTDSLLLRSGVDEFLKYDYIGAPWSKPKEGQIVGNGGLSLRTKQKMIEICIKHKDYDETLEDIYFNKHLNGVGVADIETAKKFSMEDIYSPNPLGIHNPIKIETKLLKNVFENSLQNIV